MPRPDPPRGARAPRPTKTAERLGPAAEDQRTVRYAARLLAASREELHRTDTKVSVVLAGVSAVIVTFVTAALAGGWSPTQLTGPREALWWSGAAVADVAVVLLGAAIYPRTRRGGRSPSVVAYYSDVVRAREPGGLRELIERSAERELDQLLDQLLRVSRIVLFKYRLLALSMWALLTAAQGCGLAVALQAVRR